MDQIMIQDSDAIRRINVDKYKVLIGNNHEMKYSFLKKLEASFQKVSTSDYREENQIELKMKINGDRPDLKRWQFYFIHSWLNLEDEMKLGSKSILLKYLETQIQEVEFNEYYQLLNQSIISFNEDFLSDVKIEVDDSRIAFQLNEITQKTLVKNIASKLLIDDFEADELDLPYYNKFAHYIKMISLVANKNRGMNFLVTIDCPSFTHKICTLIEESPQNTKYLINCNHLGRSISTENIIICGKKMIDLADEESVINEIMIEHYDSIDYQSFISQLQHSIDENYMDISKISIINRII